MREADRIMKEVRMRDFEAMSSNLAAAMSDNPNLNYVTQPLGGPGDTACPAATKFGSKHPRMIELQSQIEKVQAQID